VLSGFLVFLIALPLCLGIASASEFPPIAGVWTAVIGGLVCTFISNSQMTIKGPAAGLIVIVLGAVTQLGAEAVPALPEETVAVLKAEGRTDADIESVLQKEQLKAGYRHALAVGIVAGVIQILFGLFRLGALAEICPMTPVHALLAAIGVIIMFKQAYPLLGMKAPGGEAIQSVIQLPASLPGSVPQAALIGLVSLAVLSGLSMFRSRKLKVVPAQLIVLLVAVPLALLVGLDGKFRVQVPDVLGDPAVAFALPDFSRVLTVTGIEFIVLFALIGSLESLVSAKAVDLIDPYRRKTNLNRDLLAIGVANTLASAVGALPMISEIVRSKANIDNGARTRNANLFHGLFLLLAALFLPRILGLIPTAALAAMLVFTGFRLAHPREFVRTLRIGPEQLLVFFVTIVTVLATDLLVGFLAGIATKVLIHFLNGMPASALVTPRAEAQPAGGSHRVVVRGAAVFACWLSLKKKLESHGLGATVTLDLSEARLVDHTVMEKLHLLEREFAEAGGRLQVVGLDGHRGLSKHPRAARKKLNRSARSLFHMADPLAQPDG
jgi:MFS superfamily sulfate permease-like transporter